MDVYSRDERIFAYESKPEYGSFMCLYKHCQSLCLKALEIFADYQHYFSLEFVDWIPRNLPPVGFVFENLVDKKYLVKFANNLEVTEKRLSINTTGMKAQEVEYVF